MELTHDPWIEEWQACVLARDILLHQMTMIRWTWKLQNSTRIAYPYSWELEDKLLEQKQIYLLYYVQSDSEVMEDLSKRDISYPEEVHFGNLLEKNIFLLPYTIHRRDLEK